MREFLIYAVMFVAFMFGIGQWNFKRLRPKIARRERTKIQENKYE
jgi:hypothetical protein